MNYISRPSTIRWDHGANVSFPVQSAENHRIESLILVTLASRSDSIISNVQTSASKKISIFHGWLLDKL